MKSRVWHWLTCTYIVLFILFMLSPIFFVVLNSFNKAKFSVFPPSGFSFQWYVNLLQVPDFFLAMRNSAIIALAATVLATSIGTTAGLAIVRGRWRQRELVQSIFMSPLLVPKIVFGVAVFVAAIKVSLYPSFTSIILAHTILILPYVMTIIVANLHQVQRAQEEAAMDLGANPWQTFRLATVPQIARGLALAAVFGFILSFDEFDVSIFLARASNMTIPLRMFLYMQEMEDPTLAALSTLLIAFSIIGVVFIRWLSRGMNLIELLGRRGT
jgi:putative spermidine/putrescine transport system permease protein